MKSLLKFILIILISVSIVQLYSCKKKTSELDTEKPYLSIVEPMANDTTSMAIEPEIHVEFTATDNDQLKSLSVTLKDGLNNILFSSNPTVDGLKSYTIMKIQVEYDDKDFLKTKYKSMRWHTADKTWTCSYEDYENFINK